MQDRLQAFVSGGQLGPFANNYWPHEAYLLDPEENMIASTGFAVLRATRVPYTFLYFAVTTDKIQTIERKS